MTTTSPGLRAIVISRRSRIEGAHQAAFSPHAPFSLSEVEGHESVCTALTLPTR